MVERSALLSTRKVVEDVVVECIVAGSKDAIRNIAQESITNMQRRTKARKSDRRRRDHPSGRRPLCSEFFTCFVGSLVVQTFIRV